MTTVILDCSTFLSGAFFPSGNPRKILELWQENDIALVVTEPILEEYERKINPIAVKMKVASTLGEYYLRLIKSEAVIVKPRPLPPSACRDPDDIKYLEAAMAAKTEYLITSDNDLLVLKRIGKTKIVSPAAFLLNEKSPRRNPGVIS